MPLFNGRDLTGWDTWLGKPHKLTDVPGHPRNEQGEYTEPIGLNKDPRTVFSVVQVDGAAAIRISGEIYGGLITRDEYENYHLRFEFKWGTKRWPPREAGRPRQRLLLPLGRSARRQLRLLDEVLRVPDPGRGLRRLLQPRRRDRGCRGRCRQPGRPEERSALQERLATDPLAPRRRIIKASNHERPTGEWNTMDLYCLGHTSVHVVNGNVEHGVDGPAPQAWMAAKCR